LDGIVRWSMRRFGWPHRRAIILTYALFIILLISIPALLGSIAVDQIGEYANELSAAWAALLQRFSDPFQILGIEINPQSFIDQMQALGGETVSFLTGNSVSLLADVTSSLYWGLLIVISVYYLLSEGESIKDWMISISPEEYRPELLHLIDELGKLWRVALRVQILIFIVLAILMLLGTALIIWMFQSGLIGFSPLLLIVLLVLLYIAIQQVDNLWLRPLWMGRSLQIHPGIIFVGLMGALGIGGLLGIIVVVPLIGTAKVLGEYLVAKLSDQPYLPETPSDE
jgi:predicted PurR-regulated permease PerM